MQCDWAPNTQEIDFIADHPFIFSLKDKLNVLFVGRITNFQR